MRKTAQLSIVLILTGFGIVGCPQLGVHLQPEGSTSWASESNPWFPTNAISERSILQISATQSPRQDVQISVRLNSTCGSVLFDASMMSLANSHEQHYKLSVAFLSRKHKNSIKRQMLMNVDSAVTLYQDSSSVLTTYWSLPEDENGNFARRKNAYDTLVVGLGSVRCMKENSVEVTAIELGQVRLFPGEAIRYR